MFAKWNSKTAYGLAKNVVDQNFNESMNLKLVRFGENAIFKLLEKPLSVRVYRSPDKLNTAIKCSAVGSILQEVNFPSVYPALNGEVFIESGHPVSFWKWEKEDAGRDFEWTEFGNLVGKFHEVLNDAPITFPEFKPLEKIRNRLDTLAVQNVLNREEVEVLEDAYRNCESLKIINVLRDSESTIHADAHRGNTLRTNRGLLLLDFDNVCKGPAVWDAISTTIATRRFGVPVKYYKDFLLGLKVNDFDEKLLNEAVLLKELSMTSWLCQNKGYSDEIDTEIALRIESWKKGLRYNRWHAR